MNEKEDEPDVYTFEYVEWLGSDYTCIICFIKMRKVMKVIFALSCAFYMCILLYLM